MVGGNRIGYLNVQQCQNREQLYLWMGQMGVHASARNKLDAIHDKVLFPMGVILQIDVEEELRNMGLGNRMMKYVFNNFVNKSYLLLADVRGENLFDLVEWYKRLGFDIVGENFYPVMLKINLVNPNIIPTFAPSNKFIP